MQAAHDADHNETQDVDGLTSSLYLESGLEAQPEYRHTTTTIEDVESISGADGL